MPIDKE